MNRRVLHVSNQIMPAEVGSYLSCWGKLQGSAMSVRTPMTTGCLGQVEGTKGFRTVGPPWVMAECSRLPHPGTQRTEGKKLG